MFDVSKGEILTYDGQPLAPLNFHKFCALQHNLYGIKELHPSPNIVNFTLSVEFEQEVFGLNCTYHCHDLESCWLAWSGGNCKKLGYDTSEKQLLADKAALTKLVIAHIQRPPSEVAYTHDRFDFDWGYISTAASLRSVFASIGVVWKTLKFS